MALNLTSFSRVPKVVEARVCWGRGEMLLRTLRFFVAENGSYSFGELDFLEGSFDPGHPAEGSWETKEVEHTGNHC